MWMILLAKYDDNTFHHVVFGSVEKALMIADDTSWIAI